MRAAKLFGLAVVTALAAMAFIGAGSASATVLCEETPSGTPAQCSEVNDVAAKGIIEGEATNSLLTTNIANVQCKTSKIKIENTNTGGSGEAIEGDVPSLSFSECKMTSFPFSNCTVEVKNLPYQGTGEWVEGSHNGVLANAKGTGGNPGARVVCAGFIDCTFGAPAGLKLGVTGGNPATVAANEQELTKEAGGFLCPKTSTFHADYIATGATSAIWFADNAKGTPGPSFAEEGGAGDPDTFNVNQERTYKVKNRNDFEIHIEESVMGPFALGATTCPTKLASTASCTRKVKCTAAGNGHYQVKILPTGPVTTTALRCH